MKFLTNSLKSVVLVSIVCLAGCACAPLKKNDPLECFNRGVYGLNRGLDFLLLKPAARVYQKFIPGPFKMMIGHFFQNIKEIPTFGNDILQARWKDARTTSARFVLNTTLGIGGLCDVAGKIGFKSHTNDFGITLARWGVVESIYLVMPLWGPCTVRDACAAWGTFYMSPFPYMHSDRWEYSFLGLGFVEARADFIKNEAAFVEAAVDEYKLVRDAYLQHRTFQINGEQLSPKVNSTTDTSVHKNSTDTSVDLQGPPA